MQPNPMMDSFEFWELTVARLLLWGNFYAYKEFNSAGKLIALWPIHPSDIEPVRVDEKEFDRDIVYK